MVTAVALSAATLGFVHVQTFKKHVILLFEIDWQYTDSLVLEFNFIAGIASLVVIDFGADNNRRIVVVRLTHDLAQLVWRCHLNLSKIPEISSFDAKELITLFANELDIGSLTSVLKLASNSESYTDILLWIELVA